MNLSSPLTRAKARELARAQSPSRSVLTEPLYSSPRGSLLDNTDTSRRRKTSSRSASKFKENNTTYSSPTDEKENISINRVHKSRDQRHLDIQKRNGSEAESHQINFNRYSSFQKDRNSTSSALSSPPYFFDTLNSPRMVMEDSSPVIPSCHISSQNSNCYETNTSRTTGQTFSASTLLFEEKCSKTSQSKWFIMLVVVFIFLGTCIVFFRRNNTSFHSLSVQSSLYKNMLGRFQPFFFPRKSKKESFQTALSYITNRIADLAIASEKTSIPSETIVEVIQGIMEKTDNILKDGFPRHELKQWRERLYRQLLDFIAYNDIIDISSNDSVAKLLESKLKWYYKLTEQDYALSSKGAKIVHSTPSKIRQQSRYWLARIASLLDPAIRTTILRYPKGPETILSDDVSLGNCWAFAGKTATITIQLSKVIQPVAFSLEHSLSSESKIATPNAPKLFRVYLIQDKMKETGKSVEWIAGTFYYQMESGRRQLFPIRIRDLPYIDKIRLEILDNYGGSYTCVYHFGVHGHEQQNISQA